MLPGSGKSAIYGLYDLDVIDTKIVEYLQQNGREAYAKIADEVGIPASTVRDRTNRMIASGVLKIVALVNPMLQGQSTRATLGLKLAGGNYKETAADIAARPEVMHLVLCAGRFDLLADVACKDSAQLLELVSNLQDMPQVQQAETFIHYGLVKGVLDTGALNW